MCTFHIIRHSEMMITYVKILLPLSLQLLDYVSGVMLSSRSRQQGAVTHADTSQLLLVVSDGRGLFLEGMNAVQSAVRLAREANVFLVFVIIDNPENKVSYVFSFL